MRGSSCRSPPAAALRGLANSLFPGVRLTFVQRQEVRLGDEHFAADFDQRRRFAMQPIGHRFHGAKIGGDVLAFGAVAAGRAAHETAVLIGQIDRQSVDFRFGDKIERSRPSRETDAPAP